MTECISCGDPIETFRDLFDFSLQVSSPHCLSCHLEKARGVIHRPVTLSLAHEALHPNAHDVEGAWDNAIRFAEEK